jgi:DNA modification methylase
LYGSFFAVCPQHFKSIYFSDHPSADASRRNLKVAFGEADRGLYDAVSGFSSCELRSILGAQSLHELRKAAGAEDLPVNTYCVQALRRWSRVSEGGAAQLSLPSFEDLGSYSTFRAGRDAPFQRWYPWLEGYSPDFVRQVLNEFAPQAATVLDPFGGCGTTPITGALLGKRSFYCELNPLLQFIVEAKVRALLLSARDRKRVVSGLSELAVRFEDELHSQTADARLRVAYVACFGSSQFFEGSAFEDVLRARSVLDRIACQDPLLAQFATVSVVASLIPSSKLKRAGDLRFRRGNEVDQIEDFVALVRQHLSMVAEDIAGSTGAPIAPVLVSADARALSQIPPLGCDAVVTSPPYLNGTNYFRNTKVELWFLRSLRTPQDLAALRLAAVTAGINDVTRQKSVSSHPDVLQIVSALEQSAYDARIPQMVGSYFHDMEAVLRGVALHMKSGAILALDIGDSIYAGQRVATDRILSSIAEDLGFSLRRTILLRNRVSRDATPLRQVLLVFQFGRSRVTTGARTKAAWASSWKSFKSNLPHQEEPFAKRNWGHPLHSLCSYQGKMKPSLAHFLVDAFVPAGGRMLDPFAGVGTIPFEAALQGARSYGFEISPAALPIAGAKVGRADPDAVSGILRRLERFIADEKPSRGDTQRAAKINFNSTIPEYFEPRTMREVLLARRFFQEEPVQDPSTQLVFASILHILHGNRPYALSRRSHPITPFAPTGPYEYKSLIRSLSDKLSKSMSAVLPATFEPGTVYECDATGWWPQEVTNLDAIVTSPPFFASTRFYLANWMRLWFAGWEREDFDTKPRSFLDERQRQSFRVYEPIFRQARERLNSTGAFVLHLGRSKKCDMAAMIAEVALPWFTVADQFSESVAHCESHGIRDKGTVTDHQFLVLR